MITAVPHETAVKTVLTNREQQVVELLCDGLSEKQIADHLGVSKKTVSSFKRDIFKKAGVHKDTAMVRWAIRMGLVQA